MIARLLPVLAACAILPASASQAPRLQEELASALSRGDFEIAIRASDELIAIEEKALAPDELAALLDGHAQAFYGTETPQGARRAEELFRRALDLLTRTHGSSDPALLPVMVRLADLLYEQGRFEESLELDRRALTVRRAELGSDHRDVGVAERNLGVSLTRLAYLREGQEHLERALSIAKHLDPRDFREEAYALKELAENLRVQNRYVEARQLLEEAVTLAEDRLGRDDPELVELLISLSGIYRDVNRFAECQWRHRQAWEVFERSPQASDLLKLSLLNNEGEIRRFQGDAKGAERYYREALELSSKVFPEAHPRRATYMNQLALLLLEHRRYAEAEPLLLQALDIRTRVLGPDHPELADTHLELGELYGASGRTEMALESLGEAIAIRERQFGPEHPDVATALVALAEVSSKEDEKRKLLDRAISILRTTPAEPRTLARALSLLSRLPGEDAAADLTESLGIAERLRPEAGGSEWTRSRFLSEYLDDYNRMVALSIDRGDVAKAFEYSERRRTRALLDQMASTNVDLRSGIAPDDRKRLETREASLTSRIAESRERLRVLRDGTDHRDEIALVERELSRALDEFAALYEEIKNASRLWRGQGALADGRTVPLSDFQRNVLGANALALVFVVGEESSFLLVTPPPGEPPVFHRLEIAEADAAALGVTPGPLTAARLASVLAPDPDTFNPVSPEGLLADLASPPTLASRNRRMPRQLHALFHVLIPQAVWSRLRLADEALVIPDGLLFQLPLDALVVDLPGGNPEGVRYWLDDGPPLRYASSATLLANLERRPATVETEGEAVSISNLSYPQGGLRPLPATDLETKAIERTFGADRVAVLQGLEATEPRVRAALQGPRFLHLGTHGLVDPSRPSLFASLALAPPREIRTTGDDGWLELFEIYELKLDAELAVLSACSTRAGNLVGGEGVFALSRGFLSAGARRVVASLWPIEDQATAALVTALFEQIGSVKGQDHPDYARLLFAAKRSLRQKAEWGSPFFWAPFVIDGAR